jgi:glutamine cyclotransferase
MCTCKTKIKAINELEWLNGKFMEMFGKKDAIAVIN